MKRVILVLLGCWNVIFAIIPFIESETKAVQTPTVILVSMDGFRADYFDRVKTPHFEAFRRSGTQAANLKPVFPSVTFVNHYSIISGRFAEHHGIVNNSMWDPKTERTFEISDSDEVNRSDWWEGEPIWVTAEKQGVTTGTMFWVGSSAEIAGKRPTYWLPYDESFSKNQRVDKVLEWLDRPELKRPKLITLYFEDVDQAGHRYGPHSEEVAQAISKLDEAFGRLLTGLKARGLENKTYILLVSDHGMAEVKRSNRIRLKNYIQGSETRIVGKGALSLVWPKDENAKLNILERVKKLPGHFKLFKKESIPERFHYSEHRRIAPLVFLADEGWYLDSGVLPSLKPEVFGLHGYDNDNKNMQAIFVWKGPGVQSGNKVGEVQNVDIYSLLAHLLKVEPANHDGNLQRIKKVLQY